MSNATTLGTTSTHVDIPSLGGLVWVGPHRPPEEMMETWVTQNPKMIWSIFKDHTGFENQSQIDAYAARNAWSGVADCMRYELLYKFGGIFVDADSECIKPLADGDFFENTTAFACYENEAVRPGMIGCGFLGAPRGSAFFRACIDEVARADVSKPAWEAVGPMLMVRVATRMPDALKLYPAKMFNPTHYTGTSAPGDHPVYAKQGWGSTKTYNTLRKLPCACPQCWNNMLRPTWG